jgi:hypothetical protein
MDSQDSIKVLSTELQNFCSSLLQRQQDAEDHLEVRLLLFGVLQFVSAMCGPYVGLARTIHL